MRCEGESMIGLWGGADSGKTHLVNASAHFARQQAIGFQLYDGLELLGCDPGIFQDLSNHRILAIDNLDAICGCQEWEERFYHIINRCRDGELQLIYTLSARPQDLDCQLADFKSRLSWGLLLQLQTTEECNIGDIIRFRAGLMGIDLSKEVIAYLLTHYSRRLSEQIRILRILDAASLTEQKKITVPMIKQALIEL
jgi:DnaA family protein